MGTFTWFHECAPYELTPHARSSCSSSSNTFLTQRRRAFHEVYFTAPAQVAAEEFLGLYGMA